MGASVQIAATLLWLAWRIAAQCQPSSLIAARTRSIRVAVSSTSSVPESDLRRAFQKKCRNVILNHDPSRADYALEPIARTNPLDGERPRYRFTLFNRAGNAIYSTLPHKFSNAVDNICNPLAQSTADSTVKITDASEPNSPLSVSGDVSFHQEFSANIEAT